MSSTPITNLPTRAGGLFQALGSAARLEILLAIGAREACVCHLEAALGQRQAYISQHLMALRDAGLITSRRDGRFVFYRLSTPELLALIQDAARLAGMAEAEITAAINPPPPPNCTCPLCQPQSTAYGGTS